MEMHHKLRRDPNWHRDACNICGQMGHQAAMCPNGNTVNWRAVYGDEIFKLRRPIFESELRAHRKRKEVDTAALETQARAYAQARLEATRLDYEDMARKAQEAMASAQDAAAVAAAAAAAAAPSGAQPAAGAAAAAAAAGEAPPAAAVAPLPDGWAEAKDPTTGKTYFYHKTTQKVQWDRPTAETPAV